MKFKYRIAGKTRSEILLMKNWTRSQWYKTILPEEKAESKKLMMIVRLAKLNTWWTPERRAKRRESNIGKNNPMYDKKHTEDARDKQSVSRTKLWKDLEYRNSITGENHYMYGKTSSESAKSKNSAAHVGKNNSMYIDGRTFDPQYDRRYRLGRFGLPDEFIEQALYQKKKRTDIELIIEYWLLNNSISYEFQKYIKLPSTWTRIDFFVEPNICLYCDGNRWHELEERRISDERITEELELLGFRVIRVWGNDIHDGVRPLEILEEPQLKYEQQLLGSRGKTLRGDVRKINLRGK